ncbi:hypothetical protein PABG_11269 [Paracoccidioides brasiliensis Pb03]|uniref:Uncharacterized protein n=1 Tax=Paracoccidioides brasiliensis (strain Pb18) TaxID=502780 RepID=A0A0A0HW34_PARBD|nr:uncharacterized protein PADG_11764 [Paracoccidioides brasiliensis Pb18]KGM92226.1 hypothetical protein PADG_11764 [Paracoccidioides brasiliensis Pb18]KGY15616.1 hypothetical protein PABG_11269 [Paracoccidioides brasiliensis Pb03]ODH52425.1 hypothetical protein GX48_01488 [Paracoccidioides brasiliensis]
MENQTINSEWPGVSSAAKDCGTGLFQFPEATAVPGRMQPCRQAPSNRRNGAKGPHWTEYVNYKRGSHPDCVQRVPAQGPTAAAYG